MSHQKQVFPPQNPSQNKGAFYMNSCVTVLDDQRHLLGLFTSAEIAEKSIRFSFHKIANVKFDIELTSFGVSCVRISYPLSNGQEAVKTLTIQASFVSDRIEHL